jgi:hypothetical protein
MRLRETLKKWYLGGTNIFRGGRSETHFRGKLLGEGAKNFVQNRNIIIIKGESWFYLGHALARKLGRPRP